MKNWKRIFLTSFLLIGGATFFVFYSLTQFNDAFDDLSDASNFTITKTDTKTNTKVLPPSDINKEQIPIIATSTDLGLSFVSPDVSPEKDNEVYIDCTYELSFQSSATLYSVEIVLIDDSTGEIIEPIISGLTRENEINPNSQSLDWKVGAVLPGEYSIKMLNIDGVDLDWPGEYSIKMLNIDGVDLENTGEGFKIEKMAEGMSTDEKEEKCRELGISS